MKQVPTLVLLLAFTLNLSSIAFGKSQESLPEQSQSKPFEILYFETLPTLALKEAETTTTESSSKASNLTWSVEAFGKQFNFTLEENTRLIAKLPMQKRKKINKNMKFFLGTLEGIPGSWIRLTHIGKQWSGMFWDGQEAYIIDPMSDIAPALRDILAEPSSGNGIYRLSDTRDLGTQTCGMGESGGIPAHPMTSFNALIEELEDRVGVTAVGATRNIDMAIVTDQEFTNANADPDAAVIARMNIVDGIFSEQLGVQISLVDVLPLTNNDGGLTSTNAGTLLNQFGNFTNSPSFNHPGVAHLFSGKNLDGSTIGIAFLRSLCSARFGVGVNQITGSGTTGALTVAHELGHNFGAPHDNQSDSPCAATPGTFLMNPFLNGSDQFSPCSISQIEPIIATSSCITIINFDQADLQPRFQTTPQDAPLGQPFSSIVTVANNGQASALGARVEISIPNGLALENVVTNAGSCSGIGTSTATCALNTIPAGAERVITLTLNGASPESFLLIATVFADNDLNLSNNTTQGTITIDNAAPLVTIDQPQNGTFVFGNQTITFVGQAQDAEDGDLTATLVWTSNLDGQIGTGGTFSNVLTPGIHTISASATDQAGKTTAATIMVTVTADNPGPILFDAHFDSGVDGFSYRDDAFRNTLQPQYAQGTFEPQQGFSDGGLRIQLGGLDDTDIDGMSGGWERTFTLDQPHTITIAFRFKLDQSSTYEQDEFSEALFSVNGQLIGVNNTEILAQLVGDGNGGLAQTTNWIPVTIPLGLLPAGPHTITIGTFNNKKTFNDETTDLLIDDVEVRGLPSVTNPPPPPPPPNPPGPNAPSVFMNFQPPNAPVPTGFQQDTGATYTATRGYGWSQGVSSRERQVQADSRLDSFVFVGFGSGATWQYDLPNGSYQVTLASGDPSWAQGPHQVTVEGITVINNQPTQANAFIEVIDQVVSVTDGQLTIQLVSSGSSNTMLNYVQIIPAGTPPPPPPPNPPGPNAPSVFMNFQPPNAPVPTGFQQDTGATYTATRGYGWSQGVSSRERQVQADSRLDSFVFVGFGSGATWQYDLPNGSYQVTLASGDPSWAQGPHQVTVEGITVINNQPTQANAFIEVIDQVVSVTDGQLTIQLVSSGSSNTMLNYVQIIPVGAAKE